MNELQQQLNIETILTAEPFQELLELAIDAFLSDPEIFNKHLKKVKERYKPGAMSGLVNRLGLWSVREALESADHDFAVTNNDEQYEDDSRPYIGQSINLDVQLKIEAFGSALLEEAFVCLGDDADEKIAEIKATRTKSGKLEVYNWLAGRLEAITKGPGGSEEDEDNSNDDEGDDEPQDEDNTPEEDIQNDNHYHPARLSPKIVGKYPNIQVAPTCLGISIIASSFFERARIPYLHAGVTRTAIDEARDAMLITSLVVSDFAKDHEIELPDNVLLVLKDARSQSRRRSDNDRGFHAATYSALTRGEWVQTDPNYSINVRIRQEHSQNIKNTIDNLKDIKPSASGVEVSLINRRSMVPYYFWDFAKEVAEKPRSKEEIEEYLLSASADTTIDDVVEHFLGDFFDGSEIENYKYVRESLAYMCKRVYRIPYKKYVEDFFIPRVAKKLAFPDAKGKSLAKSIERCKTDSRYLSNRVEDLQMLPLYMIMSLQLDYSNEIVGNRLKFPHPVIEAGLPQYRIGAAVLSDLAVYTGDELPPSFWLSYWPSHISFAEHANQEITSPAQAELVRQTAEYIASRHWTYNNVYGIVDSILEQEGGDEDTSHRQDEAGSTDRRSGTGQ